MNNDDIPLAATGCYDLGSERPLESEEEQKDEGPLEDRLVSKQWKTRANAYDEFKSLLTSNLFESLWDFNPTFIGDSNPSAQEKALEAFSEYLKSPVYKPVSDKTLIKVLVEKALSSVRSNIKSLALSVFLDFIATKDPNSMEDVNEALVQGLANRNVKIWGATVQILTTLLQNYGIRMVSVKQFLPAVEKLASSSNASVRGDVLKFYAEVYRWIRDAIRPTIEKLKKQQQDELEKMFAEITDAPIATRQLASEQGNPMEETKTPKKSAVFDAYDMAETKDIFTKYNDRWCDQVLNATKWIEKKNMLVEINAEASAPKLAEKSTSEIWSMIRKLLNDSNIQVVMQSMKLLANLSKGQRGYFSGNAKGFMSLIMAKFTDKKLVNEVHSTLDAFVQSLQLDDMMNSINEALADKAQLKLQTALFISRLANNSDNAKFYPHAKTLVTSLKKNINNGASDVRDATLLAIGKIKGTQAPLGKLLDGIEPAKMAKIDKASGIESSAPSTPVRRQSTTSTPKSSGVKSKTLKLNELEEEKKSEPSDAPRPPTHPVSRPQSSSGRVTNSTPAAYIDPTDEMNLADAEDLVSIALPSDVVSGLSAGPWKQRQEAIQQLKIWIEENPQSLSRVSEGIVRTLKHRMKDWKENNFNVIKETFEVITMLANASDMSRRCAALTLVPQAVDKIADIKLNSTYYTTLSTLSSNVGPKFVSSQLIKHVGSKPKVVVESATAICKLIGEFGIKNFEIKTVVEFGKTWISGTNPTIKNAGQKVILTVYEHWGSVISPLISDIKDTILRTLEEKFKTITVITYGDFKSVRGEEEAPAVSAEALLDEALPRVAVPIKNFSKALTDLENKNWKERKSGLEQIEAIFEQNNMRILPTGLGDLVKALILRLGDSNKSIIRTCLGTLSKLADALGPQSKGAGKQIIPAVIQQLSDKQAMLRADALSTLETWASVAGLDAVVAVAPSFLIEGNPELKGELLGWLVRNKDTVANGDVKAYVPALLNCLQDRNAGLRNQAEILFDVVMPVAGWATLSPLLLDMKPAALNNLKPILDQYQEDAEPFSATLKSRAPAGSSVERKSGGLVRSRMQKNQSASELLSSGRKPRQSVFVTMKTSKLDRSRDASPAVGIFSIQPSGKKENRLRADIKAKWNPEELRQEYVEKLKDQLRICTSSELHNSLFSKDFKAVQNAISFLQEITSTEIENLIEMLDLIFKWSFTKLYDWANPTVTKVLLDFLLCLIQALACQKYLLLEGEATLLLPILCIRVGHNNATYRQYIRNLICEFTHIYPVTKICAFLLQTLNNKNNRTKSECLEIIGSLVQTHGVNIILPRDVKNVSGHVASTESMVRTAAVGTIGEIYKHIGDRVWKQAGNLQRGAKDLLEQRFRTIDLAGDTGSFDAIRTPDSTSSSKGTMERSPSLPKLRGFGFGATTTVAQNPFPVEKRRHISVDYTEKPVIPEYEEPETPAFEPISPDYEAKTPDNEPTTPPNEPQAPEYEQKTPDYDLETDSPDPQEVTEMVLELRASTSTRSPKLSIDGPLRLEKIDSLNSSRISEVYESMWEEDFIAALKSELSKMTPLERALQTLSKGEMPEKVDALVNLNEILSDQKSIQELCSKSDMILEGLSTVAMDTFVRVAVAEIPIRFAKYYLNIVYKTSTTIAVIRESSEISMIMLIETLLKWLLIDEIQRLGEKGEGQTMVKLMNSAILKLLENGNKTKTILTLLSLLKKYKGENSRMISLITKCLVKLVKVMSSIIKQLNVQSVLEEIQRYIQQVGKDDDAKKAIKQLLGSIGSYDAEAVISALNAMDCDKTTLNRWIAKEAPNVNEIIEESKDPEPEFKISEFQQRLAQMKEKYGLMNQAQGSAPSAVTGTKAVQNIKQRLQSMSKGINKKY